MDKKRDRNWRNLAGSIGAATGALLMVGVVTFGANGIRPMTADPAASFGADAAADDGAQQADGALGQEGSASDRDGQQEGPANEPGLADGKLGDEGDLRPPKDEPVEEPQEKPAKEPVEEPKDEPAPTEKPHEPEPTKPPAESGVLHLEAWTKEGKVKLAWSKYDGDRFEYYKIVRSRDATVRWPLGEGDELVGVVSEQYSPWFVDPAPCGKEWHYRVFAVRHGEDGYKVLAESNMAGAYVECAEEPADPYLLGFELKQVDGGVKLFWEACTSDGFVAYKVVRSKVHENPTFPLNDGTQLIAVFEDHTVTSFKDTDVAAGQTWTYRVYSMAKNGDGGWVVLGLTKALSITVE